jgi:hypothetical protein
MSNVLPIKQPATWGDVRDACKVMQRKGYEMVLAAADVGAMLIEIKDRDYQGDDAGFVQRAGQEGIGRSQAFNLMSFARHRPLIEKCKPQSQRQALKMIAALSPKVAITADTLVTLASDRDVARANAAKSRMTLALSTVGGYCEGLERSNLQMAIAVCDDKERKLWAKQARMCARALLRVASKLENAPAHAQAEMISADSPIACVV